MAFCGIFQGWPTFVLIKKIVWIFDPWINIVKYTQKQEMILYYMEKNCEDSIRGVKLNLPNVPFTYQKESKSSRINI